MDNLMDWTIIPFALIAGLFLFWLFCQILMYLSNRDPGKSDSPWHWEGYSKGFTDDEIMNYGVDVRLPGAREKIDAIKEERRRLAQILNGAEISHEETADGKFYEFNRTDGRIVRVYEVYGETIVRELDRKGRPGRQIAKGTQADAGKAVKDWLSGH